MSVSKKKLKGLKTQVSYDTECIERITEAGIKKDLEIKKLNDFLKRWKREERSWVTERKELYKKIEELEWDHHNCRVRRASLHKTIKELRRALENPSKE